MLILAGIAILVTIGVYGLVGVIVKIDDLGYYLADKRAAVVQAVGKGLLALAPWLMKGLTFVGTLAMFLVGGGILVHGVPVLHHVIEQWAGQVGGIVQFAGPTAINLVLGFVVGGVGVLAVKGVNCLRASASHVSDG